MMEYHISYSSYGGKTIAVSLVTLSLKNAIKEAHRLAKKRLVAKIVIFDPNTVITTKSRVRA